MILPIQPTRERAMDPKKSGWQNYDGPGAELHHGSEGEAARFKLKEAKKAADALANAAKDMPPENALAELQSLYTHVGGLVGAAKAAAEKAG